MTNVKRFIGKAIATGLFATALNGRCAVPISPELQNAAEAGRTLDINMRAEASLQEKLEAGRQRYAEKQAFRQELVQGMASNAEERRQEIAGNDRVLVPSDEGSKFDLNSLAWGLIISGIVYQAIKLCRNYELERPAFGFDELTEAGATEPAALNDTPEGLWKNFVRTVRLPPMTEASVKAQQNNGEDAQRISLDISVKICVDIPACMRPIISEERLLEQLQKLFEPYGISADDNSQVWLALVVHGSPFGKADSFRHAEKIVFFDKDTLTKKTLLGGAIDPVALWGAEYSGCADAAELENDLIAVLQVFAEVFYRELLASKPTEAVAASETSPPILEVSQATV